MNRFIRLTTAAAALALFAAQAAAHHIWIEQDAQGARLYFGEFADNLREVSPGLLDKFQQTRAQLVSAKGGRALEIKKTPAAFIIAGKAGTGESIVAEADYPAYDKKEGEQTQRNVWVPAARFITDHAAQSPKLTLDIVPTGKAGEFQVFYRGQPLPKAKLATTAASGWSRETQADELGKFSLNLPWAGAYGIEVKHSDKTPGERGGEKFDAASYVTTLTLAQANGLVSPPAPPKAQPNQ